MCLHTFKPGRLELIQLQVTRCGAHEQIDAYSRRERYIIIFKNGGMLSHLWLLCFQTGKMSDSWVADGGRRGHNSQRPPYFLAMHLENPELQTSPGP